MRRRLLLLIVVLVLGCGLLLFAHRPRPGVSHTNLARIQNGMTEQQVEAVLGGPGGDFDATAELKEGEQAKVWIEKTHGRGGIIVYFDKHGGVHKAFAFPHNEVPP